MPGSFVKGFDLASGEGKISAKLPGDSTLSNDMVGPAGSLFVTNSLAPQILKLKPGSNQLSVWLENPTFEQPPQGAPGLDGIAFGDGGNVYVNTFANGNFFRIEVKDGAPGKITKLKPSRALQFPEGCDRPGDRRSSWLRAAEALTASPLTAMASMSRPSRAALRDRLQLCSPVKRLGSRRVNSRISLTQRKRPAAPSVPDHQRSHAQATSVRTTAQASKEFMAMTNRLLVTVALCLGGINPAISAWRGCRCDLRRMSRR